MLKPMGKKHLPHSRRDEWRAPSGACSGPKLPAHMRPLLVSNGAALRLQLRYQKYQEKVRTLLKKADASQQQEHATKSGRAVAASSMALAVTIQARREDESSVEQPKTKTPLRLKRELSLDKWGDNMEQDWLTTDAENEETQQLGMQEPLEEAEDEESGRQHGFVNVMEPSWLLASIEQRCAETASSLGLQSSTKPHPSLALQLADVRLAVLDLLFICRSGIGVNLLGRSPSAADTHHRNLVMRVKRSTTVKQETELTTAELNRVTSIFESLKSDMFMPAVRCLGWLLTKSWRLLFHGLHVDLESLHHVRRVLEASEGDVSVVFAPTHKSHLDYLIISYLCFAYGIPLPRIAAGNNLDLPLVGSFLRANGSFFIRRSFRNDHLYKDVLEQYVHELLHDGNPVEVFIEGGRSRHGRVCKPRLGFMSMFLNYVKGSLSSVSDDNGVDKDESPKKTVLIVPISLDYDKVYEVDGYANQLLGKPKEKESLAVLFRSVWDLFFLKLGHSYVRFGEPVPLTETSSLQGSSDLVVERMQTSGTITSTVILSALLMWKRTYMTQEMLETRTVWLVDELEKRGATVAHVEDDDIAAHAMAILNVKTKNNGIVAPQLKYPVRALELGFYRNHLLHIFLPEMAVIGALDTVLRQRSKCDDGYSTSHKVDIWVVKQQALKIWHLLRHICRHEPIDIKARLIQFLAEAPECQVDESSGAVMVDVNLWKISKLASFVLSLNWSFMDSLWLTTQGLWSLLPVGEGVGSEHTERDVVRCVQVLAKELFLRQQLFHAEALCSESIKQSLDFLMESGVVRFERSKDGKSRVVRLSSNTDPVRVLEDLTREMNARRKPRSYLWRDDEPPRNLSRDMALELMEGAESSHSIYANWMTPPSPVA
ncbi:Glycerol-3-phosphate acyltransferase [Phytophthora megakarya]|uniref:Glycerol-3-phosphate acyltransferase n=1 Tax=Phytophthora megakarya TaxID=4795 RepID=A0A225W7M4_9STRA|nr:Glycerol-3-phosphate acyltransferase [Phytophthora megakarya]